jgi:hypothetical protein
MQKVDFFSLKIVICEVLDRLGSSRLDSRILGTESTFESIPNVGIDKPTDPTINLIFLYITRN